METKDPTRLTNDRFMDGNYTQHHAVSSVGGLDQLEDEIRGKPEDRPKRYSEMIMEEQEKLRVP